MPDFTSLDPMEIVWPVIMFLIVATVALGVRYIAFRAMQAWARRTKSILDDLALQNLRLPSIALCLLLGLYAAIYSAHLPVRFDTIALYSIYALLVITVTTTVANFVEAAASLSFKEKNVALPATGLSLSILKVTIWVVGVLVLLGGLGVSITPMITALGIGGLAVSLALQDTLSNFFAGLHLLIEKPVRLGDFVKLEWGQEGYVASIGWRSTRLRMRSNELVIVPNNKLMQSVLINYSHRDGIDPKEPVG
jgi:small-conductance mechanosensitive channel